MITFRHFLLSIFVLCGFAPSALASPPVLIEIFGRNECVVDTQAQESIFKALNEFDNVMLINCRRHFTDRLADNKFAHKFCNKRANIYKERIGFGYKSVPLVIVNGRWDASIRNVLPAVKLGKADKIKEIELTQSQDILHISLPELEGQEFISGKILVYAYLPTQMQKTLVVDPDLDLTAEIKEKIENGQSVPFVTEVQNNDTYLKPVIAMDHLGDWNGKALQMTYPLKDIQLLSTNRNDEISYIVVVHEGDENGKVIATGEILSSVEQQVLSNGIAKPQIEQQSLPVTWVGQ